MTQRPWPPATDQLIVSEYQYHKYVFSPALGSGLKYAKAENVSFERLKADISKNNEARAKFRSFAHALCDGCNAPTNDQ